MDKAINRLFGEVRAFSEDVEKTRTIEFIISTEKKDRHGTVIPLANWKLDNFNKNGIVGYQHNVYGSWFAAPDPDDVIGIGRAWVEDGQLIGSVKFETEDINPQAEKIFRKVLFGTLRSTSVGFYELTDGMMKRENPDDENSPKYYEYGEVELLEFSIVNIPSNTDAVKRQVELDAEQMIESIVKKTIEKATEQREENNQQAEAEHANFALARLRLQEIEMNLKPNK
jgi:hypothetical protein